MILPPRQEPLDGHRHWIPLNNEGRTRGICRECEQPCIWLPLPDDDFQFDEQLVLELTVKEWP